MIILDGQQIEHLVTPRDMIDALETAFRDERSAPERQVVEVPGGDGARQLLVMPAFAADGSGVVKLATVFPENRESGAPTIQGALLAFDATGAVAALLDAASVTRLRTAAASALAARYLARADSRQMLMVGTGALAPYLVAAHASVRPIEAVRIWGRNSARVAQTVAHARALVPSRITVSAADDLAMEAGKADVISCATSASEPLLKGAWLRPGTHIDLVGSFSPDRRECDDDTVRRARLFVDTLAGAMAEAGDILMPMKRGVTAREDICGELADLVAKRVPGRTSITERTVFKSVGTAIEDLAAARLILTRLTTMTF